MDDIQRMHLLDLEIKGTWVDGEESFDRSAEDLTTGLLVQFSVLIPPAVERYAVYRFTGPRTQLEELANRYRGVPGAFAPSTVNPDSQCDCGDPSCTFVGTDPNGYPHRV